MGISRPHHHRLKAKRLVPTQSCHLYYPTSGWLSYTGPSARILVNSRPSKYRIALRLTAHHAKAVSDRITPTPLPSSIPPFQPASCTYRMQPNLPALSNRYSASAKRDPTKPAVSSSYTASYAFRVVPSPVPSLRNSLVLDDIFLRHPPLMILYTRNTLLSI